MIGQQILGIDPGGRYTGLVRISRGGEPLGDPVLEAKLVMRDQVPNWTRYLYLVLHSIQALLDPAPVGTVVAVEGLNPPNPHMGMTSVKGLLDTAQVLGAILSHHPGAVLVEPGGHGSQPLRAYPPELVGERERSGTGQMRHLRSAYDIARAGAFIARVGP